MLFRVALALLLFLSPIRAQGSRDTGFPLRDSRVPTPTSSARSSIESNRPEEPLSSTTVSRTFYDIAYELAKPGQVKGPALEQAIIFLTAAMKLDANAKGIRPLLIEFASRDSTRDHSSLIQQLLADYVDEFADLEVVRKAVGYLLERANSREEREALLEQLLGTVGNKNNILGSEIGTMLGVLKAEKADMEATTYYLIQAYRSNRYNTMAFAKLVEVAPDQISPAVYLERLRLALRENPSDIDIAIGFAEYAEKLQLYETAAGAYQYCADLFDYLFPTEALPSRIYLPWAISSYNTRSNQSQCLRIAERIRGQGQFDLRLEAIAAKTAIKLGDNESATQTFQAIEQKAQELFNQTITPADANLPDSNDSQQRIVEQLAWFYCFALPIRDNALKWAHKAYEVDSNSSMVAALLAYALVMNDQIEWAKPLINNYERSQISELTLAQIQLAQGQTDVAISTLSAAIARDPGSFAAERAREILAGQGREYVPSVSPDAILASLDAGIGQPLIPVFIPPERTISARLDLQGNSFPYGSEFTGMVVVTNHSSEPMVMSDDGLFKGNIRIDAEISGDLSLKIPNLVFTKIQAAFLVDPNRSILIPVRLMTGELRRTFSTYPQASLNVEFTLYLDPVLTSDGSIANRLTQIPPFKTRIERPGIELTAQYLRDQFNSIAGDQIDRKMETARLFTGLLMEQKAMPEGKPLYKHMSADWVEPLLRSALTHESGLLRHPGENEWVVKVDTMAEMYGLPLDHELITAVAENLNHAKWPVRMMAMYLLAEKQQGVFGRVLDWTIQNDPNPSVREMATVMKRAGSGP